MKIMTIYENISGNDFILIKFENKNLKDTMGINEIIIVEEF